MPRVFLLLIIFFIPAVTHAYEFKVSDLKAQVYGELHFALLYTHANNTFINNSNELDVALSKTDSFDILFYPSSRIGVHLFFVNFTGRVELQGKYKSSFTNLPDSIFRLFYIAYNFKKAGSITVGKDWSPAGYYFDQYANEWQGLCGYGVLCQVRVPQIRYNIAGFEVAALYAGDEGFDNVAVANADVKSTQVIPRFEAAYTYESDKIYLKIFGAYGRYTAGATFNIDGNSGKRNLYADTYSFGILPIFYINNFSLALSAFVAQNVYLYGAMTSSKLLKPSYSYNKNRVDDVLSLGAAVIVSYQFTNIISASAGAGYTASSDNSFKTSRTDDRLSVYINLPLQITKYLKLIPEVSYFDELKDYQGRYEGQAIFACLYFYVAF